MFKSFKFNSSLNFDNIKSKGNKQYILSQLKYPETSFIIPANKKDIGTIYHRKHLVNYFILELFIFNNVFLMPAERTGLHLLYNELSVNRTKALHNISSENSNKRLQNAMHSRYAKPIANYIDWLNDLTGYQKNSKSEFHIFAEKLKRNLAGGVYKIDNRTGNISFKPYQKKRGKSTEAMGLHMTSSTVKSLVWLVVLFRISSPKRQYFND